LADEVGLVLCKDATPSSVACLTDVWVVRLLTPHGRDQRVSGSPAVVNQTVRGFTDEDSKTRVVVVEAYVVLGQPAKFEFVHRLLGGTLHGGL